MPIALLDRGDFGLPLGNDAPDLGMLVGADLVQPLRAGIQGTHYDLLEPGTLQLPSFPFPILEDALAVPPSSCRSL